MTVREDIQSPVKCSRDHNSLCGEDKVSRGSVFARRPPHTGPVPLSRRSTGPIARPVLGSGSTAVCHTAPRHYKRTVKGHTPQRIQSAKEERLPCPSHVFLCVTIVSHTHDDDDHVSVLYIREQMVSRLAVQGVEWRPL